MQPLRLRDRAVAWAHRQAYGSFSGALLATGFLAMSLTPSLLPRTWLVQGLISGVSAVTGYAIGAALGRLSPLHPSATTRRYAWYVLATLGVPLLGLLVYQSSRWQRDLYALMGERQPARIGYLRVALVTVAVFVAFLSIGRTMRGTARVFAGVLVNYLPPRPARLAGGVLVALVAAGLVDGLVYDPGMSVVLSASASINDEVSPQVSQPTSPTRSGGPGSAVSWASLGLEGRAFVGGGPTVEQLRAFSRATPTPPIRVYAGMHSAPDIAAEAALAVQELRRTGAFDRKVLCLITTTGTGWVDPRAAESLEYLYNGDTAEAAIQYSVLPSWLTYLVERHNAEVAGRQLYDAVHAYWATLPAGHRPRLVLFGESLGTLGGEAAVDDLDDLTGRVDGILWAGPLHNNPLWSSVLAERDRGSTAVDPSYRQGRTVRFETGVGDGSAGLTDDSRPWAAPRVVYVLHASDPITWWSPTLALRRPDWLHEARGPDVSPAMRWYPFVTFWQVTADLVLAQDTRLGHGHRYGGELASAWAAIVPPPGWSPADTARLVALIDARG